MDIWIVEFTDRAGDRMAVGAYSSQALALGKIAEWAREHGFHPGQFECERFELDGDWKGD